MSNSGTPSQQRGAARQAVDPRLAVLIVAVVIALLAYTGYRWMNQPQVPTSVYVNTAKDWIEKPEREKMTAQGISKAEIDAKIQGMWDSGKLKLPPGEPGVDWAGTPMGIIMLPKKPGDLPGPKK